MHEPPFDVNRPEWTPLNFYPAPTCTPLPDLRLTPSGRPPEVVPRRVAHRPLTHFLWESRSRKS